MEEFVGQETVFVEMVVVMLLLLWVVYILTPQGEVCGLVVLVSPSEELHSVDVVGVELLPLVELCRLVAQVVVPVSPSEVQQVDFS